MLLFLFNLFCYPQCEFAIVFFGLFLKWLSVISKTLPVSCNIVFTENKMILRYFNVLSIFLSRSLESHLGRSNFPKQN